MRFKKPNPNYRSSILNRAMGLGVEPLEHRLLFTVLNVTPSGRPLGVDVSHFQGTINWATVTAKNGANGEKDFAIIKGTGSDEGDYLDSKFSTYANGARAAGMIFGTYHYAFPTSATSATAQADYMIAHSGIAMEQGNLPPMLDFESGSPDLSATQLSVWANAFCDRIYARLGVKPIIYASSGTYGSLLNSSVTSQWKFVDANYGANGSHTDDTVGTESPSSTGNWPTWTMWQYNSVAHIPGIGDGTTTNVDSDVFNGTFAQLQAMEISNQVNVQDATTWVASGGGTDNNGNAIVENYGTANLNGTSPTMTFTIQNEGATTVTLGNLTAPSGYTITEGLDGGASETLPSLGTDTITIKLNTGATGTFAGNVTFTTNDPDTPTFKIPVTGSVTAPALVTVKNGSTTLTNGQTTPINFGSAVLGGSSPGFTFTVSNPGGATLTTAGLTAPTGFSISSNTLSASIAAGGSDTFGVLLNTTTAGTFTGNVSFTNNVAGQSPFTFAVTGTVTDPTPTAPTGLHFTSYTNNSVTTAWTDTSNNETAFLIERKTGAGGTYVQVGSVGSNVTSWVDSAANDPSNVPVPGTLYYYQVRAQNGTHNSGYTPQQSITTLANVATNVVATDGSLPDRVTISWTAAQGAASYQVYRASTSNGAQQAIGSPVATTSIDDTSAVAQTIYYYWVAAINSAAVASAEAGPDTGFSTGDITSPTLVSGSFNDDLAPSTISFKFSEPMQTMSSSNLAIANLDGGTAPGVSGYSYSSATNTATFSVSGNLADAHFQATLSGAKDLAGNSLSGQNALNFTFLMADASGDGTVDSTDFGILAASFGTSGATTFSQGDFNHDGVINALDFNALASAYGNTLLPAGSSLATNSAVPDAAPAGSAPALSTATTPSKSLFGNQPITQSVDLLDKGDNSVLT